MQRFANEPPLPHEKAFWSVSGVSAYRAKSTETLTAAVRRNDEANVETLELTLASVKRVTQVGRGSVHAGACAAPYEEQHRLNSRLRQSAIRSSDRELPVPAKALEGTSMTLTMGLVLHSGGAP